MNQTLKAGAIIERQASHGKEYLLLYRADQQDWTFPKGHIEDGEDAVTAMQREVREETGLETKQIQSLPTHTYSTGSGEPVSLSMFLITVKNDHGSVPKSEHKGDILRWVQTEDVSNMLTHKNLRDYFLAVINREN